MLRRLGLVSSAFVLVLSGSAHADSWSSPDPVGDAVTTTFDPEPQPCGTYTDTPTSEGDIRRVSARHTRDRIDLAIAVTGLTRASRTWTSFTVVTPTGEWWVDVSRREGRTTVDHFRVPPPPTEGEGAECGYAFFVSPRTCRGAVATIDVAGGRVTASLPRRCLGTPSWIEVGAQVYGGRGGPAGFSDVWRAPGPAGDPYEPSVGRRLYAGPRR